MSSLLLEDESATRALAARAGRALPSGPAPLVVYLDGDLGTGKTSFARGMLEAMGEAGPVRSPTYGLIAEYPLAQGRVVHMDLYRLRDASELEQLGLRDLLMGSRLWLVEWPERGTGHLPPADATLRLTVEGIARRIHFEAATAAGRQWLAEIVAGRSS